MKKVTLLGATGTIGQNTLKIIARHPDKFSVTTMSAQDNFELLAALAKQYKPHYVAIGNVEHFAALKQLLAGEAIEISAGEEAIVALAAVESDIVISAIVGAAALKPTLAAIRAGRRIALANKECLVCAGELMNAEIKKYNATIIPVDSEHNGLFQLFEKTKMEYVEHVTITASGGPFREHTLEQMKHVTPAQAIKHPNWTMGAKISVDSATLMNKGLELIEAYYLFPLKTQQLNVLIHPQSIVHALVHMNDGSVLAHLSNPDMCTPIAHAMAWPERIEAPVAKLNLADSATLQFETVDEVRFPALKLAKQALNEGGAACTILNAANEIAVARFLKEEIGFLDITKIVYSALEKIQRVTLNNLDDVLALDASTRRYVKAL